MVIACILVGSLMLLGCYFINDSRAKHGVCCGKACPGCKVFEKTRRERLERDK